MTVDSNVVFRREFCSPLEASVRQGDLAVYWSPTIQREIAKVSFREFVLAHVRSLPRDQTRTDLVPAIRHLFDEVGANLEAKIEALERLFLIAPVTDEFASDTFPDVPDPTDRPLLRAARAADAPYLLTLDQRHLPHGVVYHGVQCWHPDTFLTLFYQQNLDAFERAVEDIPTLPEALTRRLLP